MHPPPRPTRPTRPTLPTALLALAVALVPGYVVVAALGADIASDVVYLAVMALAAAAATSGLRTLAPAVRPTARLGAVSLVLYGCGDLAWYVITWAGGDPDGSVADVLYLGGYVAIGLLLFVLLMPLRAGRWRIDADVVIDVLTVVSLSVLLMWELVVRLSRAHGSSGFGERTELIYPIVDSILLGLALRAVTHSRARGRVASYVGIALVCWLAGDYGYLFTPATTGFTILSSVLFLVGALLIAHSTASLGAIDLDLPLRASSTAARLSLAIGPLLVPPGLVVVETLLGTDPESMSLVVGIVVLIALAFARTERLLATERRTLRALAAARDAALEASRAKSTFLASISHEIRTPMNGVLGLSHLLAATPLDEDQRHYVRGIEKAGGSLMTLLNDVLDFAKFEGGRVHLEPVDFDVVELIEAVAEMVSVQAHHQGLELVAVCSPELPRGLHGDPTRLRQVLLNLASNAVKFTADGEVVITAGLERLDESGPVVRFAVADTGIGIAAVDQERLFEAFGAVDLATPRSYGGTGLGLAIVRELVTAMGGEVGVESVRGRGSTFWCALPLGPARHHQPIATRPSRALPGTRALVVDDNVSSAIALRDQLTAWGLHATTVTDGQAALERIRQAHADGAAYRLVVTDLRMPVVDGLELTRRIRADPDVASTPVLLLTSGPEVTPDDLRTSGVTASLAKPTQVSRLQGAVQRALGSTADEPVIATRTTPASTGRGVVLVVEDSEVNQMVAVGTLRQLGYFAEVAANGLEAVEMVATRNYDAVLMDCRMPVMDGYQAATEIRRQGSPDHRVPIIAVTASAVSGDRERCLEAGMDDYLVKPLGRRQLADTLARWVGTTAAQV